MKLLIYVAPSRCCLLAVPVSVMTQLQNLPVYKEVDSNPNRETVAIVMHVSLPWLQKKRCEGGGIPFSKPHKRQVNYMKSDVLAYIEQNKMAHTA